MHKEVNNKNSNYRNIQVCRQQNEHEYCCFVFQLTIGFIELLLNFDASIGLVTGLLLEDVLQASKQLCNCLLCLSIVQVRHVFHVKYH